MERYRGVRGRGRVTAIAKAIEASGGRVLREPDPGVAPFEFQVELPDGSRLDLVCYAFTANEYRQKGRPPGEHRFQVKYGSDFHRAHNLFIDAKRKKVTLFFGVHEDEDLFIAADPAMHNPTWFSMSVEFKETDLEAASRTGWHGWERERVATGRRRVSPLIDLRTEALLAFRPEHFLTYARLERVATDLDAGERLLLIDSIGTDLRKGGAATELSSAVSSIVPATLPEHPLLAQFGIDANALLDLIGNNLRLLTAVRGGVAEHHLHDVLRQTRGVTKVTKLVQDGPPDFEVVYRRESFRIECKNVLRKLLGGRACVDFQKTRASKKDPCSRYYSATQFEILAACMHPITQHWDFRFGWTKVLPPHKRCPGKLGERVLVGDDWSGSLADLLDGAGP